MTLSNTSLPPREQLTTIIIMLKEGGEGKQEIKADMAAIIGLEYYP